MKLSELSRRDYIAIEIVGHLAATNRTADICTLQAYEIADAMIAYEGRPKRDHELEDLRDALKSAELVRDILREFAETDEQTAAIALAQIWKYLGVDNQTEAMATLREWAHPS